MIGDECYRCKKKFVDKDKMAIHIGAEHKKVDQFLRELGIESGKHPDITSKSIFPQKRKVDK